MNKIDKPFEVHIIIDPTTDEYEQMALTTLIANYGFKLDEVSITGRFNSVKEAKGALGDCVQALRDRDFKVRRGKIEHILVDLRLVQ